MFYLISRVTFYYREPLIHAHTNLTSEKTHLCVFSKCRFSELRVYGSTNMIRKQKPGNLVSHCVSCGNQEWAATLSRVAVCYLC